MRRWRSSHEGARTTWIHTNGTRVPRPIKEGLSTKRIHILCSVDAGSRETWKLIKKKDFYDIVCRNLEQYLRSRCRVVLKYIMKDENCSDAELAQFISMASRNCATELLLDIDYDYPNPSASVMAGLRTLRRLAALEGIFTTFGSTGAFYTPEVDVAGELASRRHPLPGRSAMWLRERRTRISRPLRGWRSDACAGREAVTFQGGSTSHRWIGENDEIVRADLTDNPLSRHKRGASCVGDQSGEFRASVGSQQELRSGTSENILDHARRDAGAFGHEPGGEHAELFRTKRQERRIGTSRHTLGRQAALQFLPARAGPPIRRSGAAHERAIGLSGPGSRRRSAWPGAV